MSFPLTNNFRTWRSWESVIFYITANSYCSLVVRVLCCCKSQGP